MEEPAAAGFPLPLLASDGVGVQRYVAQGALTRPLVVFCISASRIGNTFDGVVLVLTVTLCVFQELAAVTITDHFVRIFTHF